MKKLIATVTVVGVLLMTGMVANAVEISLIPLTGYIGIKVKIDDSFKTISGSPEFSQEVKGDFIPVGVNVDFPLGSNFFCGYRYSYLVTDLAGKDNRKWYEYEQKIDKTSIRMEKVSVHEIKIGRKITDMVAMGAKISYVPFIVYQKWDEYNKANKTTTTIAERNIKHNKTAGGLFAAIEIHPISFGIEANFGELRTISSKFSFNF